MEHLAVKIFEFGLAFKYFVALLMIFFSLWLFAFVFFFKAM